MKTYIFLLLGITLFFSCTKKIIRPSIEGLVYDSVSKKPINNVEILTWNKNNYIVETKTNERGVFNLKKKDKKKFLDLDNQYSRYDFIVKYQGYISDTIKIRARAGFIERTYFNDTIYLKPVRQ